MANDWITGWRPPPIPGTTADPAPATSDPNQGLEDFWSSFMRGNEAIAWMFQWGFGKLTTADPEGQLAEMIYRKLGPGQQGLHGYDSNQVLARQAAHQAMQDPAYRQQLTVTMGWNATNPHVAYWMQHGGPPPADPMGSGLDASGTPKPAPGAGGPTTAPGPAVGGEPFDPKLWVGRANDPGFTYGAALPPAIARAAGVANQWGVDYALPMGAQLPSPFAGTIQEADFNGPYGNTVVVKLTNGLTYRIAHLSAMNVKVGDTVAPGQLLGLVGSTGNSTGPHVLIEMHDPSGKPIDPTPIIDSLLKGDTATATTTVQDYFAASQNRPGPILTLDGHLLYPGSSDYNVFYAAQSLWRKRYGGDPPWSFVSSLIAAGETTAEQVQNRMDQMTSDIAGMPWGQRDQLTADANKFASAAWSRPLPDSTIKQLAAEGITTPGQIQGWVNSHPANAVNNADYTAIYDKLSPQTTKYWDQPPSPDMVVEIHKRMQQGPA